MRTPTAGNPAPRGGTSTSLVLLLVDHQSLVPSTLEEKTAVALELAEKALEAGLRPEHLIFDPVLPHLSWPDAYAQISRAIQLVRLLSSGALFKNPVRTLGGLSNLRSGHLQFRTNVP